VVSAGLSVTAAMGSIFATIELAFIFLEVVL
jgi:hypothetical protein